MAIGAANFDQVLATSENFIIIVDRDLFWLDVVCFVDPRVTAEGDKNCREQQQADYLVRMFLINSYQNIPVSIWYDWKNDGTNPNEREHQFGTVKHDMNPKAAYLAVKVLSSTLAGYSINEKIDLGNEKDFAFKLTNGNREAVAFWTLGPRHNVTLPIEPTEVTLVGIYGGKVIINWKTKHLNIRAEQSPQYLLIKPKGD